MEVRELPAQPVISIRVTTAREKMAEEIRRIYGELARYVQSHGTDVSGPPYASYQFAGDDLTLDAGFRVAEALTGEGEIVASELPAGRHAVALHTGSFEGLGEAYQKLFGWMTEHGLQPAGPPREVYLTDPETTPPDEYRTEIVCLVR